MGTKIPLERAASELDVTPGQVRVLIEQGRLALPLTLEGCLVYLAEQSQSRSAEAPVGDGVPPMGR